MMASLRSCFDAIVERHQLTEKVSSLTTNACKPSATSIVERAEFNERLSKVQCEADVVTKAREVVEKELAELRSMLADAGPANASVLEKAWLSVPQA